MPYEFGKVALPEITLQHYSVGSQVAVERDRNELQHRQTN